MLWYGIICLWIGGTVFSYVADGRTGLGSTITTTAISPTSWVIPVQSLSGFVPDKYGEDYIELDRPNDLVVGGTEGMKYTAGVWTNRDPLWRCQIAEKVLAPPPCLIVERDEPVAHSVGEHVFNENASALNDFIGFRVGQSDTPLGALTFPFQALGAIGGFLVKVLIWDWTWLEGNMFYFRLFVLIPLNGMVIVAALRLYSEATSLFRF